jgi:hypothetical protein
MTAPRGDTARGELQAYSIIKPLGDIMAARLVAYSAITLRFSDGPYESNFLKLAGTLTFYG